MNMFCAECGEPLTKTNLAWEACCNSAGYWANLAPLKNDIVPHQKRYKDYFLYLSSKSVNATFTNPNI